jgi:putative transposase
MPYNSPTEFYDRNLPHRQPKNAVLAITIRLYGSLPKDILDYLQELKQQRLNSLDNSDEDYLLARKKLHDLSFLNYDTYLDQAEHGPTWLSNPLVAQLVIDALLHFGKVRYKVICYCIMSSHIHFVFYKLDRPLSRTMQNFKSYTGKEANKLVDNCGHPFWAVESYDHYIRDRPEFVRQVKYVLDNPVKAKLVNNWRDWRYSYLSEEFLWVLS